MRASQRRLQQLKQIIPEVTARQAFAAQADRSVLIDVREPDEVAAGSPAGAASSKPITSSLKTTV